MEDPAHESVDVVIVNYRSYDELGRCLASLEPNHDQLGRVAVIDHESNLDEASRISARFPWAHILERSTNEGFATGVNLGARAVARAFHFAAQPRLRGR